MDLSVLLAREGIQADDAEGLVAWARQRAAALVARIEPDSALAHQLGASLESARSGQPVAAGDVPIPVPRQPSRSAPRPINRQVSSPHLGAAVQAALTRNEPALEKALEIATEPPPAPEPAPPAVVAEAEEDDPSIGGFNRFAFSLRRRASETPVEQTPAPVRVEPAPTPEDSSDSAAAWQAIELELPAPPGFETRPGHDVPAERSADRENSDSLVVGIPDDDSIDIPIPRPRSHSASRSVAAATPVRAPSGPHSEAEAEATRSSERLELDSATLALDGLDIDIPDPPVRETTRPQPIARPSSSPSRAAPPPPPPRSGPHRAASGPTAAAAGQSGPVVAARPPPEPSAPQPSMPSVPASAAPQKYPTPQSSARRGKTTTAEQKQVPKPASEPKPAATKKGNKGRKKVVDLSVPVPAPVVAAAAVAPRKASIGNHQPTGEPSSPGHQLPAYLQDDDE